MTYEQAERKLKRIAKGNYCAMQFETTYSEGKLEHTECGLYIDGYSWTTKDTWDEAFFCLKLEMQDKNIEATKPAVDIKKAEKRKRK